MKAVTGLLLSPDHWVDAGGRSLAALEELVSGVLGEPYRITELQLVASVAEMRDLILNTLNMLS